MRRKLFTAASALSLLLCVATLVLWVRSGGGKETRLGSLDDPIGAFAFYGHKVFFFHWARSTHPQAMWQHGGIIYNVVPLYDKSPSGPVIGMILTLGVPLWMVVVTTLILPLPWMGLAIRRLSKASGRCTTCGYDLTGNTSGICPECGTAVAGKAAT